MFNLISPGLEREDRYGGLEILSALKGEDSHGTAPLVWDVEGS